MLEEAKKRYLKFGKKLRVTEKIPFLLKNPLCKNGVITKKYVRY